MRSFFVALISLSTVACGDEVEVEANRPDVLEAPLVQCREVNGRQTLDKVEFIAQDLDGGETIQPPIATIGAVRLPLTAEALPWTDTEVECETESCQVKYVWERPNSGPEQIYCGEDGTGLTLQLHVEDEDGFIKSLEQSAAPLM